MDRIEALLASVHRLAGSLDIKKYDLSGRVSEDISVSVQGGRVDQMSASDSIVVLVRVWHPSGAVGVASTSDISEGGLETALAMAREVSTQAPREDAPIFSPEATAALAEVEMPQALEPVTAGLLAETLLRVEQRVLSAHPAMQSIPYNGLSQQATTSFYLHSEGATRRQKAARCSLYLYPKAEEVGRRGRMGNAVRQAASFLGLDIDGCVEESVQKVLSHLDYEKIPSGRYGVVFSPSAILALLGAFSNLWNARHILDQKSLSRPEDIGKQIASPCLSLSDYPLHPYNIRMPLFDGEGTPTRKTPIISDGQLVSFLHCANTAMVMGQPLTGHAVVGARVSVDAHYLHLQRAKSAASELSLESTDDLVYVDKLTALHAGTQALQGSFSLPFDGWRYQRGERRSIEAATVAGDILPMLKQIVHISHQEKALPSGAAADVWVEELSIAGSES